MRLQKFETPTWNAMKTGNHGQDIAEYGGAFKITDGL
jgi:hypothetical protein